MGIRPGIKIVADFAQEFASPVELKQLGASGSVGWAGGVAARENENVSLGIDGYTGCLANMLSFPADVFPKSTVASVYGLASMGSGFGGMLFTLITGWVVENYSYTPVFIGFGLIPLICATILWTLTRTDRLFETNPGLRAAQQ